ncbi:uncharacterized protein N7479_010686 [Penicillium vulpinum]|uniref:Cell pattern formation-associated protein stuA n=1 Tax=Penicillium vulpinum TaxID=29845 RepID=A0A1V6S8Z3_9EURO|nr:uncharacterized protein N7479_010686 [Penicillium vulpinum]KAJ5952273.1 hypothetical protein N7479_010686 [Penicillium vulpinum]OQE10209.1 hypothetical protein PENVUL_c004G07527 [Penicillium vulpinum]
MSRTLPKQFNPLILAEVAPTYEELLSRRRLGKTNLSVKPAQIGTTNATKPENLGVFEYAHLRAPLPKDLKGSEIFPSHSPQQHPDTYFLMRRSKDGFVSATGMFKIAFPWAKAEEERTEREYLKAREYTSEEEVAGNVWISPAFALELSKEYQMYDWVRALLDPTDIIQSPSSAKKQITPPPKFEIPADEPPVSQHRNRRGRSASPSKRLASPRKSRTTRTTKDVPSTPSTTAANANLQSALDITASALIPELIPDLAAVNAEPEVVSSRSPGKSAFSMRKLTRSATAEPEEETKEEKKKEKKKAEKKEKKKEEIKEQEEPVEAPVADDATGAIETTHTTVSLDMPISLPEVPSAAETAEMIAQAKGMVEEAIKAEAEGATVESTSVKIIKKRKSEEDDEEETAESSQRAKKAKVLENKLKQERVRNRSIFGVSVAFALAASIPYFF